MIDNEMQSEIVSDIESFANALNGDDPYFDAVKYVADAKVGYYGGPDWGDAWLGKRGHARLEIEEIAVIAQEGRNAIARVRYFWQAPLFRSASLEETLSLTRTAQPSELLLEDEDPHFWQLLSNEEERTVDANSQILNHAIHQILHPQPTKSDPLAEAALTNLKHLGLAANMFAHSFNGVFACYPQYVEQALESYLQNAGMWKVPGYSTRFTFNPNLSSYQFSRDDESSRIVLFYEGQDQKPLFRYAGKAAIGFADGHAVLVSPDEMKELIWQP
ncbi:hypothetical protein EON80_22285 [bacterium]|nr:MAG: hypothetical protein EON80_22285 [bacterium]